MTEQSDICAENLRIARKSHECDCCRGPIKSGIQYWSTRTLFDGSWTTYRVCIACRALTAQVTAGEWTFVPDLDVWVYEDDETFEDEGCQGFVYRRNMARIASVLAEFSATDIPDKKELWRLAAIIEDISEELFQIEAMRDK